MPNVRTFDLFVPPIKIKTVSRLGRKTKETRKKWKNRLTRPPGNPSSLRTRSCTRACTHRASPGLRNVVSAGSSRFVNSQFCAADRIRPTRSFRARRNVRRTFSSLLRSPQENGKRKRTEGRREGTLVPQTRALNIDRHRGGMDDSRAPDN